MENFHTFFFPSLCTCPFSLDPLSRISLSRSSRIFAPGLFPLLRLPPEAEIHKLGPLSRIESTCWPGFWLVVHSCAANEKPDCLLTQLLTMTTTQKFPSLASALSSLSPLARNVLTFLATRFCDLVGEYFKAWHLHKRITWERLGGQNWRISKRDIFTKGSYERGKEDKIEGFQSVTSSHTRIVWERLGGQKLQG